MNSGKWTKQAFAYMIELWDEDFQTSSNLNKQHVLNEIDGDWLRKTLCVEHQNT
jgi:hypothetical protein